MFHWYAVSDITDFYAFANVVLTNIATSYVIDFYLFASFCFKSVLYQGRWLLKKAIWIQSFHSFELVKGNH